MRALTTLLLVLLLLSIPATAEPDRERPAPERVYRQLREEPVIRTREEALEFLADASPGALWRSSKLCVDRRIKEMLALAGLESLDQPVQSQIHASMLAIRASFWTEDPAKLSSAGKDLREIWESGRVLSAAEDREAGQQLQVGLLRLAEEVEMAVALQRCARAEPDLGTAAHLDCLLRGGPAD